MRKTYNAVKERLAADFPNLLLPQLLSLPGLRPHKLLLINHDRFVVFARQLEQLI
jgi:hypothetical protein